MAGALFIGVACDDDGDTDDGVLDEVPTNTAPGDADDDADDNGTVVPGLNDADDSPDDLDDLDDSPDDNR